MTRKQGTTSIDVRLPTHKRIKRMAKQSGRSYGALVADALEVYGAILDSGGGRVEDADGNIIVEFGVEEY